MNATAVKKVVNYDPTVTYFSSEHVPFAVIGAFFLGTFGIIPPLILMCYISVQICTEVPELLQAEQAWT